MRIINTLSLSLLFAFALAGCRGGASMQDLQSGAKTEACRTACEEARGQCEDKCNEEVEDARDACKVACGVARDTCLEDCKKS